MSGAIPLLPLYVLRVWTGRTLHLHSSGPSANAPDARQPLGLLCNPSTYLAQAQ
jgi:hypothetical protein